MSSSNEEFFVYFSGLGFLRVIVVSKNPNNKQHKCKMEIESQIGAKDVKMLVCQHDRFSVNYANCVSSLRGASNTEK